MQIESGLNEVGVDKYIQEMFQRYLIDADPESLCYGKAFMTSFDLAAQ